MHDENPTLNFVAEFFQNLVGLRSEDLTRSSMHTDVSAQDVEILMARVEAAISAGEPVSAEDLTFLLKVLQNYVQIHEGLHRNDLTTRRLKKLLGLLPPSEKSKDVLPEKNTETEEQLDGIDSDAETPRPGHGKKPVEEFSEAKTVEHVHGELTAGDVCPECKKGKLYRFKAAEFVRITGFAPFQATKHVVEQLRCNACQKVYRAKVPDEVSRDGPVESRYGYSAMALMALLRYGAGSPMCRQSRLQEMLKVPLSSSTIWDQTEKTANACKPVFDYLKKISADGELFFADDTSNKIIGSEPVIKKDRRTGKDKKRTGIHTSGVTAILAGGREVTLFKTGINHAGEFMDEILRGRDLAKPRYVFMSDALSTNWTSVGKPLKAYCNAHARRQFVDLAESFPAEIEHVLKVYSEVYRHEKDTKMMTAKDRLAHHQKHSLPLMTDLFAWAEMKFAERLVEPNSTLGEALNYLLKYREGLAAFCHYEGAPIDNNLEERKLKRVVLHRKNSLFFKSQTGAAVYDVLASMISTAEEAGVNVHEYLVTLLREQDSAKQNPEKYLPWNIHSQNQ